MEEGTLWLLEVAPQEAGQRLDTWLAQRLPQTTRSQVQRWIRAGRVLVDDVPRKPAYRLRSGEEVQVEVPPSEPSALQPEPIPLDILYEDEALLVLNKPRGLVVHPAPGHPTGTLVHALLHHCPHLRGIGGVERPGIVHRLDKDTTGLMVVAKTEEALWGLAEQIGEREMERRYWALLWGSRGEEHWQVGAPIGRHPRDRTRMAIVATGRPALTLFHLRERFPAVPALWVEATLRTGRTHQIRLHAAHSGHPVMGDPLYGRRQARRFLPTPFPQVNAALEALQGQALHAVFLRFRHPGSGRWMEFQAPPPEDFLRLLEALKDTSHSAGGEP